MRRARLLLRAVLAAAALALAPTPVRLLTLAPAPAHPPGLASRIAAPPVLTLTPAHPPALARTPGRAAIFASATHGAGASLPAGSRDLGALARRTAVRATVALAPRDAAGLAAYAQAVSTPGSSLYHRYLNVHQFAARFAPTEAQVAIVQASLKADGLITGAMSANRLTVAVTAPAGTMERAFATSLHRFALPDGATGVANTAQPTLDPRFAGLVQGIVGLSSLAPTAPRIVVHPGPRANPGAGAGAGAGTCAAARLEATRNHSYTTSQIAARYHLSDLYAAGVLASHVTVAVYELEPFSNADVAAFASCFHSGASVSTVAVDGGAGSGAGSGEAAMDVEDIIGLAPRAAIRVYEGPASGTGAYDTYARIVSDNSAQVITTSWGLCEAYQGVAAAAAESTLFEEAAVQGQTILASSGDNGADDCSNHQAAVDDPASQPWVTGVGASSIGAAGESVWNNGYGASGGGVSQLWARPAYQLGSGLGQTSVTCGAAGNACREVPDVTADGDPSTGYVVYFNGSWSTVGGTSISTPTWAALAALADSSPACAGHPIGFANPALYRLAASAGGSDFADVTSGDNGYDQVSGFSAGAGYDMASGLGAPNAGALVPALCGDSLTLRAPASQRSVIGQAQHLGLSATSSRGASIRYAATGLPPGLTLDPASGTITGVPATSGASTVTVTAADAAGATIRVSFRWVVSASASGHRGRSARGSHRGRAASRRHHHRTVGRGHHDRVEGRRPHRRTAGPRHR